MSLFFIVFMVIRYVDARGYSARTQQITSAFPDEVRRQYRRYVSEVVDTYGMHI